MKLRVPSPRDKSGTVVPHDHPEIANDDILVRGITEHHIKKGRISSGAFKSSVRDDPYFGMSVDLLRLNPKDSTAHIGSVRLTASTPRSNEMIVGYDPIKDDNLAHCQIWRVSQGDPKRITKGQSRVIHKSVEWQEEISGINIR